MFLKDETVFVVGLLLIFFCEQTHSECRQLTACSCAFSNGQGYSLSPLVNHSRLNVTSYNYTFYFHPCTNVRMFENDSSTCSQGSGVSLCAEHNNEAFSLGTAQETSITLEADNSGPPVLTLRHKDLKTVITLVCRNPSDTHLLVDSPVPDKKEYHLLLISPYACVTFVQANGLSTGSMLVIYFFVFTGIYFIGGAIALKLLRGATGWEMVPNHGFWIQLPSLVKDGIVFTFNCCRIDSYERI
ncbi:cation-dependent mannose-6-phosphate receptor [Xylocopa sonorina]|uniref:cation-dependent mannose-6-phosphate receptor n=1 Tax=Xylocopa sonorina TaxID=1818115 RepID=UPI00403A9D66